MTAQLRDSAIRRRLELNPLTTSLNVIQPSHLQTPSSALSSTSLSAPFGYNPATFTPVSAVRQYNPQQWTASPTVVSDNGHHFNSRQAQDPEGIMISLLERVPATLRLRLPMLLREILTSFLVVTPAPPPYYPPRSQRTSLIIADDPASGVSPATRVSPAQLYRSSPEPASNPIFPPPE